MLECDVVRDLLPLYTENMISPRSAELVAQHLQSCTACSKAYAEMTQPQPEPDMQIRVDTAQKFVKYQEEKRKKLIHKTAALTVFIAGSFILALSMIAVFVILVMCTSLGDLKPKIDTKPEHYSRYFGENADDIYRSKWGMDETIMPAALTENMQVQDFKMIFYNEWDAQYLSYLTVTYSAADYQKECERLAACGIDAYKDIYSVTGFHGGDPLALHTDEEQYLGFVYAINTPGHENTITYCELIFTDYFLDVDCRDEFPAEYLPDGFDASAANPYRAKMLKKAREEYICREESETVS